jgi:hypothetical protein
MPTHSGTPLDELLSAGPVVVTVVVAELVPGPVGSVAAPATVVPRTAAQHQESPSTVVTPRAMAMMKGPRRIGRRRPLTGLHRESAIRDVSSLVNGGGTVDDPIVRPRPWAEGSSAQLAARSAMALHAGPWRTP